MKNLVKQLLKEWVSYILEIIVDRMKREFSVEANVGKPQVAYRETFEKQLNKKVNMFDNQVVVVNTVMFGLRIEPQEPGAGYEFVNAIVGGAIPKRIYSSS